MAHTVNTNPAILNSQALLSEPQNVRAVVSSRGVELSWTDPDDISTSQPVSASWVGTVVVRKENSKPLNRWDGTLIVDSTTKNEYSVNPLVDSTVQSNKQYFYGIFPYDTRGWYRFTKSVSINIGEIKTITGLKCQYERANAFGDNSWYEAYKSNAVIYTDYNWHTNNELSINKEVAYFGLCWNNTQAEYRNVKCSYRDLRTGVVYNNIDIETLIDSRAFSNIIHCNSEELYDHNQWPAGLAYGLSNEISKFSQVVYDTIHTLHLGRPDYSISDITYDSLTKTFSMTYHQGIHADTFGIPLKKSIFVIDLSYEVRQLSNSGWGAWQGTNIGFLTTKTS